MTQFNAPSYDIERPSGCCALTGRTFNPGEPYMATMVEVENPEVTCDAAKPTGASVLGLKRQDICWQVWQKNQRPENLFCFWKTAAPRPNQKKQLFVDNDVLMNLFLRLADADQPQRAAFRFVLGLVLMRKKCLRYNGTTRRPVSGPPDESQYEDWWQVTAKLDLSKGPLGRWNEDEQLEMLDPHLDEQQIQQVTEQLSEVLEAEL